MTTLLPDRWLDMPLAGLASLTPVTEIPWREACDRGITVAVKQEQLLDERLSGNKLYKLYYHLKAFLLSDQHTLASFGGAYSNHLYALAAAGQSLGIKTLGVVRGEEPAEPSPTLKDAEAMGMRLVFVPRDEYRRKSTSEWLQQMNILLGGGIYWIPEGGGDLTGARGCFDWASACLDQLPWTPDSVCIPAGTGATAAGVLAACAPHSVRAYLVLKGSGEELESFKESVVSKAVELGQGHRTSYESCFTLESEYHCGGYARVPGYLKQFMAEFEQQNNIQLDPVYSAKMFFGIQQQIEQGLWSSGSKILVLHTGGLQGRRGYSL